MIGKQIKTMLEAEIATSDEFSNSNFGLSTGDDFREVVEEVLQSKKISTILAANPLLAMMGASKVGQWMYENTAIENNEDFIKKAILANFDVFKMPMQFLYWGIQIGQKMAQEESKVLKSLE